MGWRVGDRIVVAPTAGQARKDAHATTITGFAPGNVVLLGAPLLHELSWEFRAHEGTLALLTAEVINLSRNVLVTGDDFTHEACGPGAVDSSKICTYGLHTAARDLGSVMIAEHVRLERCGQRGVSGKYCLHLHLLSECAECKFHGNAIEYSQQRGIIVHGTHLATVSMNVLSDVRGSGIFIEDGNEMFNLFSHNVALCPWARGGTGTRRGCSLPGTDNLNADSATNQAGMWVLGQRNHVVGNRFPNHNNGMFFDAGGGQGGPGLVSRGGKACTNEQQLGRVQGNTNRGNARFGTYFLGPNYPKDTTQSLANDGMETDKASCKGFLPDGNDNGVSTLLLENVDEGNAFTGTYEQGDIQYRNHMASRTNNLIYWKETKNFADGCAAHLKGGLYREGNMALPDQAAFLIEGSRFEGRVQFEANHHCDIALTGVLCMPTYVFVNVKWAVTTSYKALYFTGGNRGANGRGGIFTLSPPECDAADPNPTGHIFPPGYCSLVSDTFTYLLAHGDGSCVTSASLGVADKYDNGILCSRPLRSLKVYTRGDNVAGGKSPLTVTLLKDGVSLSTQVLPHFVIGGGVDAGNAYASFDRKQGYALPVLPSTTHELRFEAGSALDDDAIVVFSDPVFGNRWGRDDLRLSIAGRDCGGLVHSQHDRRFVWSGGRQYLTDDAWGRGACTASGTVYPDMPAVDCSAAGSEIQPPPCEACDAEQAACNRMYIIETQCRLALPCLALPWLAGGGRQAVLTSTVCAEQVAACEDVECGAHGSCTARLLGGSVHVSKHACMWHKCHGTFLSSVALLLPLLVRR